VGEVLPPTLLVLDFSPNYSWRSSNYRKPKRNRDSSHTRRSLESQKRLGKYAEWNLLQRRVKDDAATALGIIDDISAVSPLIEALASGHKSVRENATEALERLRDVKAISPLAHLL